MFAQGKEGEVTVATVGPKGLEVLQDLEAVEGEGLGFGTNELQMPFLRLVQDQSKQVKKAKAEYVPGLEPGMIINTVTNAFYHEIHVVPVRWEHRVIRWDSTDPSANFTGSWPVGDPEIPKAVRTVKGTGITEEGEALQDCLQYLVVQLEQDRTTPLGLALLSFTKTALKRARKWNSEMAAWRIDTGNKIVRPPLYAGIYTLGTASECNASGQDYFNWRISSPHLIEDQGLYLFCKDQFEQYRSVGLSPVDRGESDGEEESDLSKARGAM